ncbi:MAG: methionyl-tRNA formyltransferase, partial [Candidatus Syntrophosphaera sp.]
DEDNFTTLHDKLSELASVMLEEVLPLIENGYVQATEQNESLATRTAKITNRDLVLDWELPAAHVRNQIRAYSLEPGAFSLLRGRPVKVLSAKIASQTANGRPGSIGGILKKVGFTVNCQDLQLLIKQVKPAGKKAMDAWAFQIGARLTENDSFSSAQDISPNKSQEES